jgi:serine/threonine protein kinase/Tol biopolymer transport system component
MLLSAGTRLGAYSIVRPLGAGGMGEVYLADDARLGRRVALKILSTHIETDDAAGKRLLREARAAAALDHPNVCTVYEVGEEDGWRFIAMQYIEGNTLADVLEKSPLPLATAVSVGRQIANAVAAAHRLGIVHRDIKPQNVIVSAKSHATVLDFGLAQTAAGADTMTASGLTGPGVVSGTLLYMSPEQARAEAIDHRSDVFSFGIVLHEMIAGVHPFAGNNWADTLAALLTREPAPLQSSIPSELRRIVRKCLEKDCDRRYQTMRDVATDLDNVERDLANTHVEAPPSPSAASTIRSRRLRIGVAAAALLAIGALAAAIVLSSRENAGTLDSRYEAVTDFTDSAGAPALSPDGRMVTFIRGGSSFLTRPGQIYVKTLPNGEAVRLTDDSRPKFGPVFSPDGTRVAFTMLDPRVQQGDMSWDTWTVPVTGGMPTRFLPNAAGLSWIDPHHLLFSEIQPGTTVHMGLVTSTEDRREARQIYLPEHQRAMAHFSYLSPDRTWLLVAEMGKLGTFERCRLVPFDGSSAGTQVGPQGGCLFAAWSRDGRWMYFSAEVQGTSHLWRQRFPNGTPELLTFSPVEEEGIAVAADGQSIVTSIGTRHSSLWLHSPGGERLLSAEGYAVSPKLSPDGARLYYLLRRASAWGVVELRVMDIATQKSDRLLPDFSIVDFDVSSDEKEVAATKMADDGSMEIWVAALDRRTAPRKVVQGGDNVAFGANRDLVFRSIEGHLNPMNRIGLDGQNRVRLSDNIAVNSIRTSPDGRWTTFLGPIDDDHAGTIAVPVYGGANKAVCYGACQPMWSPDGASLYLSIGFEPPRSILVIPLPPGRSLPDFPESGEALPLWRKLPGARMLDHDLGIPGRDPSTYVVTKYEERRNLFRVPLPR